MSKACTQCAFNITSGVGYSEYTITGNEYECMLYKRPAIYTEENAEDAINEALSIAETCEFFREGTGPQLGLWAVTDDERAKEMQDWVTVNFMEKP